MLTQLLLFWKKKRYFVLICEEHFYWIKILSLCFAFFKHISIISNAFGLPFSHEKFVIIIAPLYIMSLFL